MAILLGKHGLLCDYAFCFRIHPVQWHNGIGLRFNILGCMSPTVTPLTPSVPTTTLFTGSTYSTVSSPTVSATTCAYWTPWVSSSKPTALGEYESAWELRNTVTFCKMDFVSKIECRTVGTHVSYDQAGENNVICDTNVQGLVCGSGDQDDGSCLDYEIRVFCDECSSTTTQVVTPAVTTSSCKSKWLPWINNMTPTQGMEYIEHEYMSLEKQKELCPEGRITRIECETTTGIPQYSAGSIGTTCDILSGLTCKNQDNYPIPCEDFKVRYYCQCAGKLRYALSYNLSQLRAVDSIADKKF